MLNPTEWLVHNKPSVIFMEESDWTVLMFKYAVYYNDQKNETKETEVLFSGFKLYEAIIDYLNEKTGRRFRVVPSYQRLIKARVQEKFTFEDFKRVIDIKCAQWIGGKMETYLRPSTLFQAGKFDGYLQEYKPKTEIDSGDNNFTFEPTDEAELL